MKHLTRSRLAKRRRPDRYKDRMYRRWHIDHVVTWRGRPRRINVEFIALEAQIRDLNAP